MRVRRTNGWSAKCASLTITALSHNSKWNLFARAHPSLLTGRNISCALNNLWHVETGRRLFIDIRADVGGAIWKSQWSPMMFRALRYKNRNGDFLYARDG